MKKTISIILIALVGLLNAQTIPTSQVKFYVNFEGNGNDYTSQKTCSNTNTTFSTSYGKVGQGAHFDGTANLKYTPSGGSAFNYLGVIDCWIRTTQTSTCYIFGQSDASGTSTTTPYNIKLNSDGSITCNMIRNVIPLRNSINYYVSNSTALNDGNWHYIVFGRFLTTDAFISLEVDGVAITTTSSALGASTLSNGLSDFKIGKAGNNTSSYIGDIDEFGVYTFLDSTQRAFRYNSGTGNTPPF